MDAQCEFDVLLSFMIHSDVHGDNGWLSGNTMAGLV